MSEISALVQDERTYIESVARQDKQTVREALADGGVDTVLRVCIGIDGNSMPTRALGYYASAIAVQEFYLPEAELQFVFPVNAAHEVNGVDLDNGKFSSQVIDETAREFFGRRFRKESPQAAKIGSFFDTDCPDEDLVQKVREILDANQYLTGKFVQAASSRGSDFDQYVAAHVLMHDTNPELEPLPGSEEAGIASRVISIGAQSERPFYLARMACQRAKVLGDDKQVQTGQMFTRHVLPPYFVCRQGEPRLYEEGILQHPVPSVERDTRYMVRALMDEKARYEEITTSHIEFEYDFFGPGFSREVVRREFE